MSDLEGSILEFGERSRRLREEIGRVVVGHEQGLLQILVALFSGGHVLLEGVPGLGKTLLVRTLARTLRLSFGRIQCTPDLMPADILGTTVLFESPEGGREFRFERGPVFAHVVLADEVNRATPKTQSALLEAMQESSVTVSGDTHALPSPFLLLATQNPIEMEGTYPLPEAQLDRFQFKVLLENPSVTELKEVVSRTTGRAQADPEPLLTGDEVLDARALVRRVALPEPLAEHIARMVRATHPDAEEAPAAVVRFVRHGASPRGAQALALAARVHALLDGRANVSFDDVERFAVPALRHRLILNFEGEAGEVSAEAILAEVLEAVRS